MTESELIIMSYDNAKCPDCGEDIPTDVVDGQACKNCEHIFCVPQPTDDKTK
jgi:hypothetical protein